MRPVSLLVLNRVGELAADGHTRREIAEKTGLGYEWTCQLVRRLGIDCKAGEPTPSPPRSQEKILADLAEQLETIHRRWVARLGADYEANSAAAYASGKAIGHRAAN